MRLIVNGKAAGDMLLREAVKTIRDAGYELEVKVTWEGGDAARYATEAVNDRVNVVVAAGGDGTVNDVANGMLDADPSPATALAIIPYGTANDFATACQIPINDPLSALQLAAEDPATRIDVGKVNGRYFINVASGGFGAEVTVNTPHEMKRIMGGAAYTLIGAVTAMKMRPYDARVFTPDWEDSGKLLILTVSNGRQCGGGVQVAPDALLNDGLLNVLAVHDIELNKMGIVFNELLNLGSPDNQHISYVHLKSFSIETDQPLQLNLDGEPMRDTHFEIEVIPACLPCILPAHSPLLV